MAPTKIRTDADVEVTWAEKEALEAQLTKADEWQKARLAAIAQTYAMKVQVVGPDGEPVGETCAERIASLMERIRAYVWSQADRFSATATKRSETETLARCVIGWKALPPTVEPFSEAESLADIQKDGDRMAALRALRLTERKEVVVKEAVIAARNKARAKGADALAAFDDALAAAGLRVVEDEVPFVKAA